MYMYSLRRLLLATSIPAISLAPGVAMAQSEPEIPVGAAVEEVVVTGLRGLQRTVTDSPVPVDVFSTQEVKRASQTDTLNVIQTLVPSFSVRRAANTTSDTFIRSPTMRGLPANKTLLLVNSRRRHKSGSVGTSGYGSQAADAAVIPSIAVKSMEVLRDGAAAQYGSDAIAGVINFNLKDDRSGGSLVVQGGQYYEGDGDEYLVAGNIGLPLTERGFLNVSAQLAKNDITIRSAQFTSSSWNAIDEWNANPIFRDAIGNLSEPLERVGRPKEESQRFVFNSGLELDDVSELYAFGNLSHSIGVAAGTYRVPGAGHNVMDNPIRLGNGQVWRFKDMYPGGFRTEFSGEVTDWSTATGYRRRFEIGGGELSADFGVRYGWNEIAYSINKTVNPSMGPDSPTSFTASSYISDELAFNADFVYEKDFAWAATPLTLNLGFEHRKEGFKLVPGKPNSYAAGRWSTPDPFDFCTDEANVVDRTLRPGAPTGAGINCASASDPVYNTLQVGSNGVTGLSPAVTGSYTDNSWSVYAEASTDLTDRLFVDVAGRYEDYESFGSKLIAKIAANYKFTDSFALRGSIGSGFRAPSAGQLYMTQVQISTVGGVPTNIGLYPATHPVAQFLGAKPLEPETSTSYSLGVTLSPFSAFTLTIDGYRIDLKDQVYATSLITVTPAIRAAMIAAGVAGADSIQQINFFQNAFDARVQGVDVVGTYRFDWENGQRTSLVGSLNWNSYEIQQVNIAGVIFDNVSIYNFEHNAPKWRANVTATHEIGPFTALLRGNFFGPYSRQTTAASKAIQKYDVEVQIDAEVEYKVRDDLSVAVGIRNLFDEYPDVNKIDQTNGRLYSDGPVDWQGGYYFVRLNYQF